MQCPICQVSLTQGKRAGIALEFCTQCGGAWLDLFQLDLILYRAKPTVAHEHHEHHEEAGHLHIATPRLEARRK